jgi:hypothetical protein
MQDAPAHVRQMASGSLPVSRAQGPLLPRAPLFPRGLHVHSIYTAHEMHGRQSGDERSRTYGECCDGNDNLCYVLSFIQQIILGRLPRKTYVLMTQISEYILRHCVQGCC